MAGPGGCMDARYRDDGLDPRMEGLTEVVVVFVLTLCDTVLVVWVRVAPAAGACVGR